MSADDVVRLRDYQNARACLAAAKVAEERAAAERYLNQAREQYAAEWSAAYGAQFAADAVRFNDDDFAAKIAAQMADRAVVALARLRQMRPQPSTR